MKTFGFLSLLLLFWWGITQFQGSDVQVLEADPKIYLRSWTWWGFSQERQAIVWRKGAGEDGYEDWYFEASNGREHAFMPPR